MHKDGPFEAIPDFVPGNLLLIVQEALRNALQHAQPTSISVTIRTKAPGAPIHLEFVDDGTDYDLGSQKGSKQGHFGIAGMMERAERLGGTLRVESTPGKETRIAAQIGQDANNQILPIGRFCRIRQYRTPPPNNKTRFPLRPDSCLSPCHHQPASVSWWWMTIP